MKTTLRQYVPSLALAALLLYAGPSWAGTIFTYTSVQPETAAEWAHDFSFPQFDPALGTLDSVHITATYDFTTSGSVSNTDQSSKVLWFQAGSLLSLTLPGTLGVLEDAPLGPQIHYKLPAFGSASYGAFSASASTEVILTGAAMASFIGTGTVDLPGQTQTQELLKEIIDGGGGKIDVALATTAGATITLQYFDAQVPEPSALALLALGACLLPLRRSS
jgi:hypothetical protein